MANIETAVAFMEAIAKDDSHGYDQAHRGGNPDYDCSSLVGTALNKAGFNVNPLSTTRNLYDQLIKCGFKEIGINEARRRGDIFLAVGKHVVCCTDSNFIVHASTNSKNTTTGDTPGDQTGREICVRAYYIPTGGWTYHLRYEPSSFVVGIDLSRYNIVTDYKKVKDSGVEFAILKIIEKSGVKDPSFEKHYQGCLDAGIKIQGVYNYIYSTTIDMAKKAANSVIQALNGRKTTVYMDIEDKCLIGLNSKLLDIIEAYRQVIESNGLEFRLYTSTSFYNSYIVPYLNGRQYKEKWIARYGLNNGTFNETYKPNIPDMKIWQYTSKNSVNGIVGYVDMNVMYGETASPVVLPSSTPKEIPVQIMGQTTANLNVRTLPSTNSAIVMTLPKNSYVQLVGDLGDWYHINVGYVSKKYIKQVIGEVTAENSLNVRSSPDSTSTTNKIGILYHGDHIILCGANGEWYKILYGDGKLGWVSGKYIKLL